MTVKSSNQHKHFLFLKWAYQVWSFSSSYNFSACFMSDFFSGKYLNLNCKCDFRDTSTKQSFSKEFEEKRFNLFETFYRIKNC